MVLLVEKLGRSLRLPSRLDPPGHDEEALLASLRLFRSKVSMLLNQILSDTKLGWEFLSLVWYERCIEVIPTIHGAFATLMVDIDYPMAQWDSVAADEYLNYSLDVLELINNVSSSLSHLGQSKLILAHGLSLFENSPSLASKYLQPIPPKDFGKDLNLKGVKWAGDKLESGKESIFREAFSTMKSTGILLLGFMISGFYGDGSPYFEIRNSVGERLDPSLTSLDGVLRNKISENSCPVKEVMEVNAAAAGLAAAVAAGDGYRSGHDAAAEELCRKLEVLERLLKTLEKETDNLFSAILVARNKLLDTLRYKQNS